MTAAAKARQIAVSLQPSRASAEAPPDFASDKKAPPKEGRLEPYLKKHPFDPVVETR